MLSPAEFYDALAPEYDRMTDSEQRFPKEAAQFQQLVDDYHIRTAVDAGCGTGYHSFLLANAGAEVTAVDLSTEMLRQVHHHAEERHLNITTLLSGFDRLPDHFHTPVDAVFCLGNTLPHLLTEEALLQAFTNFGTILPENGPLFLQILNYDRILNKRDRIRNIKERGGKTFIRFYDFLENRVAFNILTLDREKEPITYSLQTTELRPWTKIMLIGKLQEAGFTDIECYGTLSRSPFMEETSNDLVLIARKAMVR